MEIFFALVILVVGFWLGRKSKRLFVPKSSEEMEDMREESREALSRRTEKRKARIVSLAKKQGRITNDDVEDLFCISDRTANRYLNALEKEEKIKQIGRSGRGVHYVPIP